MFRQNRHVPARKWSALGALLAATLVNSNILGADKPQATPPAEAAGHAQSTPVHAGSKTGEAWNGNSIQMGFLWCEPGKFVMGSPKDEPERSDDEDQVPVTLTQGFWLGKYEVRQGQWKAVMQTEPWLTQYRVRIAADSPACWISWDDATLFCREFTRQQREAGALPEGWEYVLPTEAQWEYACRAGTTTKYSFGDDDTKLFDYAWYGEQAREPKEMNARAVGQKLPNPWGFYDMHGNVVEWCRDWYQPKYPGGTDPFVATDFNNRVTLRGGEWRIEKRWSRAACRQNLLPSGTAATVGFRVSLQQVDAAAQTPAATFRLAVISFENRGTSVAYERIGRAMASLVAGELSQLAALDVLERQTTEGLLQESALAKAELTQGNAARKKRDFADYILTGSCAVSGKQLTVVAKLSKPGIAKPEGEWTLRGSVDDLFRLEQQLTQNVVTALKINVDPRPDPPVRRGAGPTMAILPLANHSATAQLDDMQFGFAELLQVSLGELEGVRLVDRQQIQKILEEQQLSVGGLVDPATAVQVGKLLGAQRLLTGSFLELGKQLSIQVRIVDTGTAAVVGAARVTGTTDNFGELIDGITRRVAAKIEVAVPEKQDGSGGPTQAGRTLEAAMHVAAADRFRREGNLPRAAEAYQQAILIEPHNAVYHLLRTYVLAEMKDWEEIVKTVEQALSFPEEFKKRYPFQQEYLISTLSYAYLQTGHYAEVGRLLEEYGHLSRTFRISQTALVADSLIKQRRFPDANRLMEEMAQTDVAEFGVLGGEGLKRLFLFHVDHSTSVVGIPIKVHQEQARKAIQIYERVLDAAKDSRDKSVADWAAVLIPTALDLQTISDDNQRVRFVSPAERAEYQRRELEAFSSLPEFGFGRVYDLAVTNEQAQEWEQAVEAYQRFLELTPDACENHVQPVFLNNGRYLGGWIDKRIEAQYRIAHIQSQYLKQLDAARQSFQTLVREYGLSHQAGPDTLVEMHQLGVMPEIPPQSALVWGGSTSNLYGWRHLLAAENLTMHGVRKDAVTLADLAPYRLVIVNKSGEYPLMPSEILALRSYVASGGSLLIVVSPQWHAAAPILQNSLLTLFGMQAEAEAIAEARSTRIVPHAITRGIASFTARQAVGLSVPEESVLIQAGDKTVVAATDYRRGRIVVAAVGQWFTPEILLIPENQEIKRTTVASGSTFQEDYAWIRGTTPEPPLLRQTLRWLAERREQDEEFEEWRREWQAALFAFAQAQACIFPRSVRVSDWDDLPDVFDRLVANAPSAELKEESLWAAGESLMQPGFLFKSPPVFEYRGGKPPPDMQERMKEYESREMTERSHLWNRSMVREWEQVRLSSEPRYFERLVNDYASSPQLAYAKLRFADSLHSRGTRDGQIISTETRYEKLDLEPGSYPDAWRTLRLGQFHFAIDEYEQAGALFDEVAESMPASAEKGMALLNAAKSYIVLGEFNEARRRLSQVDLLPNIDCGASFGDFVAVSQETMPFFWYRTGDCQFLRQEFEKTIDGLPKNEEFQSWLETRRRSKPDKPR